MIPHVEAQNIAAIEPRVQRKIMYGSLVYVGVMILLGAQMEVSMKHKPQYDVRWLAAGASFVFMGCLAAIADKVHDCSRRQIAPN